MSPKRRRSRVVVSSVGLGIVTSLLLAGGGGKASGEGDTPAFDEGPEPVTEVADPPPADVAPVAAPDPFAPDVADEGAVPWEALTPPERAAVDVAQEWAETQNGAEVQNAFSAAVGTTNEQRRVIEATRLAGLDGIDTLGVVP